MFSSHKDFGRYNEKQWRGEIVGEAEIESEYG